MKAGRCFSSIYFLLEVARRRLYHSGMDEFTSSALPEGAEILRGYVDHIIFRNEDNGYSVFVFQPDDDEGAGSAVTCVVNFASLAGGENLELTGVYVENPTYGLQFKVAASAFVAPEKAAEIERYLSGGSIKGIGPALAKRIVKKFKKDTIRIMEDEPERLAEIKGISLKAAQRIGEQMVEKRDSRDVSLFLQKFGITPNMALRIYDRFGTEVYSIVKENPYRQRRPHRLLHPLPPVQRGGRRPYLSA